MLKQINFTSDDFFNDNYFFYIGNNSQFVYKTLMPESSLYDLSLYKIYAHIGNTMDNNLGTPSFEYDDSDYFVYEYNNDTFYYRVDSASQKGNTIGILMESNLNGKYADYMFHPKEYIWKNDKQICDKCVEFMKELDKII